MFDIQERKTGFYVGVDRHAAEMNGATRRVVAEFANVEYFHYRAWTDLVGRRYDWGDGLHHDNAGRWAVARLVRDVADGCDPATASSPFWDIRPTHWAREEIAWMVARGLATGYDNGSFRAEIGEFSIPVTRGQAVNMLWRQAGAPAGAAAHGWSDGPAWLEGGLDWAWSEGVAAGWPNGTFRPDGSITRAELARMLWQQTGAPAAAASHSWVDGAPWVADAFDWIAETGLMTGWPDGTFRANDPITRAQTARLVFRFDALPAPAPPAAPPGDEPPTGSWPTRAADPDPRSDPVTARRSRRRVGDTGQPETTEGPAGAEPSSSSGAHAPVATPAGS